MLDVTEAIENRHRSNELAIHSNGRIKNAGAMPKPKNTSSIIPSQSSGAENTARSRDAGMDQKE